MCQNIKNNIERTLSEEELKDTLKNHELYKQLLREAIKNNSLNEFVETIWKDKDRKPKSILLCGCYPPTFAANSPDFHPNVIREIVFRAKTK